ncbi:MAG: multiheme c-type cytochrome [Sulfuricaulis sp.]
MRNNEGLLLKKGFLLELFFLTGIILTGCVGTVADGIVSKKPFGMVDFKDNAGHIDLGIVQNKTAPFFPSRATSNGKKLTPQMFDPPEVCGACHTEAYQQWKGSMHSNAWADPIYRAALNHASDATGGKVDKLCMGCHTPVGVLTDEATPSGKNMSKIAGRGVQCDVCHNISASVGIGNGSYELTPNIYGRPLKFGPYKDAISPYHDTAYSRLHTQSEFCGQCHNVTHPFNRMPIERTYTEWRDSPYANRGIECQDCHMKPVRGKAAIMGKEREKIYTHYFVGGNALVPVMLGNQAHADLAREMLASAATVEIEAPRALQSGQLATVEVKVTNVGAGHKLPTGFPEGREVWVDFKVKDRSGRVIYRLGEVKNGQIEPNAKIFRVVLGDSKGNVIDDDVIAASQILHDTRILPKEQRELKYSFQIPDNVKGPLLVNADLNYWSLSQYLADKLLGKGKIKVPVIKMTHARRWVEVH